MQLYGMRTIPSWDQYNLDICKIVAARSKDPNTQIGCVIVGPNHEIRNQPISCFVNHFSGDESALRLKLDGNICSRIFRAQPDFGIDGFGIFIKGKIRGHIAGGQLVSHDLISTGLGYVDYEFSLGI